MNRSKNQLIAFASIALLLASCATKPKTPAQPEPQAAEPAPVAAPAATTVPQEELDKLLADATAERKKAFDLKLFEVLPDDYKAADAVFVEGKTAYDSKDGPKAKEKLTQSISLFKDLNAKGLVELQAQKKKGAEDMKAAALKAGADSAVADRWAAAENALAAAEKAADAGDHEAAIAAYERARVLYELAYKRSAASGLRGRIEENGYSAWDSGNYALAEKKYAEEEELYTGLGESASDPAQGTQVLAKAGDAMDEAILRYNLVIDKGRQGIAVAKKQKSDEAKAQSDSIKASVAVKDDYAAALAIYDEGIAALSKQDYETASGKFEEAAAAFEKVHATAADKRAKAEAAMKAAEEASNDSLKKAQDADTAVGGSNGTK
jgi:hypothetical protein